MREEYFEKEFESEIKAKKTLFKEMLKEYCSTSGFEVIKNRTFLPQIVKIILCGGNAVGKSSLINRLIEDEFKEQYLSTIGVDFKNLRMIDKRRTTEEINSSFFKSNRVNFQIWDTAGQERFRSISYTYFKGANGFIFCFDITRKETFKEINDFYKKFIEETSDNYLKAGAILVGCKLDKEQNRKVNFKEAKDWGLKRNMKYFETSSKLNKNIKRSFCFLFRKCLKRKYEIEDKNHEIQKAKFPFSSKNNISKKCSLQ